MPKVLFITYIKSDFLILARFLASAVELKLVSEMFTLAPGDKSYYEYF